MFRNKLIEKSKLFTTYYYMLKQEHLYDQCMFKQKVFQHMRKFPKVNSTLLLIPDFTKSGYNHYLHHGKYQYDLDLQLIFPQDFKKTFGIQDKTCIQQQMIQFAFEHNFLSLYSVPNLFFKDSHCNISKNTNFIRDIKHKINNV